MLPHETLRTRPMDNQPMAAATSSVARVDSLINLTMKPLQSIVTCQVWSTTSRTEQGLERDWRRGTHEAEGTELGGDGGQYLGLRQT
jgi:hypothetical protein